MVIIEHKADAVREAREIAATEMDEKGHAVDALRIRQGRWDNHPNVLAALSHGEGRK